MAIDTTIQDGVLSIRFARPEKKNAITAAMYASLAAALRAAASDESVRAIVIAGSPGVFTAGNDLGDFLENPPADLDQPVVHFMDAFVDLDKPVIAAVTGHAVGIGVTLLLHCDLAYLAEGAILTMPFVALGLVPEFGSTTLLPQRIGHARAAERLLLGEPMTAADALACGLVNAVLPPAEVVPRAMQAAARLRALPADAVQTAKRLLREPQRETTRRAIRAEFEVFVERLRSPDTRAALRAFFERRATHPPGGLQPSADRR